MRASVLRVRTLVLAVGLTVLAAAMPVDAQTPPAGTQKEKATSGDKMGPRDVTGTIKQVGGDGLVVVGRESKGKSREWAFALDGSTRIEKSDRPGDVSGLKVGDSVAVTYVERSGKVIAQSVKLLPSSSSPGTAGPGSRTTPAKR